MHDHQTPPQTTNMSTAKHRHTTSIAQSCHELQSTDQRVTVVTVLEAHPAQYYFPDRTPSRHLNSQDDRDDGGETAKVLPYHLRAGRGSR